MRAHPRLGPRSLRIPVQLLLANGGVRWDLGREEDASVRVATDQKQAVCTIGSELPALDQLAAPLTLRIRHEIAGCVDLGPRVLRSS